MKQKAAPAYVQEEVEKTLGSLREMERLEAGPAFLARLQARLAAGEPGRLSPSPLRRALLPLLRPALLALLIMVNIVTIAAVAAAGKAGKEKAAVSAMAAEYSLEPDDLYGSGEEAGR